jgi:hypothetical protein
MLGNNIIGMQSGNTFIAFAIDPTPEFMASEASIT